MKNLLDEKTVTGSIIRLWLLTLLVLTICTCSGPRLMLGTQILGSQTDYSLYSGKLVKPTRDVMACAILKTDDLDSVLCRLQSSCIKQQHLKMLDLEYCQKQGLMLKKCLQTKLYQYQSTTRFSLSQYKTVWTGQKQNWPTEFQRLSLQEENLMQTSR